MSVDTGQSIQSDVLDAVVALLGGPPKAWRTRFRPFGTDELPSINVLPDDEGAIDETIGDVDIKFQFKVVHTAAAADGVDKVVDLAYVAAQKLILADPKLGGLVRWTRYRSRKWTFENAVVQLVNLEVIYEVEFSTTINDPSSPGF